MSQGIRKHCMLRNAAIAWLSALLTPVHLSLITQVKCSDNIKNKAVETRFQVMLLATELETTSYKQNRCKNSHYLLSIYTLFSCLTFLFITFKGICFCFICVEHFVLYNATGEIATIWCLL